MPSGRSRKLHARQRNSPDPMIRLGAIVRNSIGATRHLIASSTPEGTGVAKLPDPSAAEIVEQEGAFYLLRLNEEGECIADTWHETLEAAKAQAASEFKIAGDEWKIL